jgi:hypothetical protein
MLTAVSITLISLLRGSTIVTDCKSFGHCQDKHFNLRLQHVVQLVDARPKTCIQEANTMVIRAESSPTPKSFVLPRTMGGCDYSRKLGVLTSTCCRSK